MKRLLVIGLLAILVLGLTAGASAEKQIKFPVLVKFEVDLSNATAAVNANANGVKYYNDNINTYGETNVEILVFVYINPEVVNYYPITGSWTYKILNYKEKDGILSGTYKIVELPPAPI